MTETSEIDREFYLDHLSDCPDDCSEKDSGDECDDWCVRIRKRRSILTVGYSDSEEDEIGNVGDDIDKLEKDEDKIWSRVDEAVGEEPFKGNSGIKTRPKSSENVIDSVNIFMGNDFFERLVNETNRYHSQVAERYPSRSEGEDWTDITVSEMRKFLGLIILMGQVKKRAFDDYWSTDPFMRTPYFSQVMSGDRFMQIMKYWHFCNNDNIPENSQRIAKVQPVIDYLRQKFVATYKPRRNLTLEEFIIPWRGRLLIRRRHPSKIARKGILVRMLCEALTGYICNIQLYAADEKELQDTVVTIVEPYKNVWHHLYQSNYYYNSVEIAQALLENKVRMCGIIRRNRGLPRSLQKLRLRKGNYEFRRNRQVLLEVWNNGKQNVKMISTIHSAEMTKTKVRYRKTIVSTDKPKSVVFYDKFTKGIGRTVDHLAYYSIFRKTRKWTKRAMVFLMSCALYNSFKIFTAVNKKKFVPYRRFLHQVAVSWTQDEEGTNENENKNKSSLEPEVTSNLPGRLLNAGKHKIIKMVPKGRTPYPLRLCKVCSAHKKKSRTGYLCKLCRVPLHKGDCFHLYHTLEQY